MANAAQHAGFGGLTAAVTYLAATKYYGRKPDLGELIGYILLGIVAAGVPDILEPALTPNHRGFAHSLTVGGLMIKAASVHCAKENASCAVEEKIFVAVLSAAYLSHLAADFCTPRSLPLLDK